jgi:hypothetical protein
MHQRTCEIVERSLFRMLSRRYAHIESNVVIIIELRLIINFHAKIAERINSKWDCSSQNVWLQSVFTFQKNKCTQKKWKNEISNFHQIFDKVWLHQYLSNLKVKERRRKWLSRRHIQRNEVFRHVQNNRSFQERRKKVLCNVSCDFALNIWEQRWKTIRQNMNIKTRIKLFSKKCNLEIDVEERNFIIKRFSTFHVWRYIIVWVWINVDD